MRRALLYAAAVVGLGCMPGESPEIDDKPEVGICDAREATREQVFELVPEWTVGKKIAIIINGDDLEERHIENTQRAIRVFQGLEFDQIYVAYAGDLEDHDGLKQFPATVAGVENMFSTLEDTLEGDSLSFLYVTGHGVGEDGKGKNIVLKGDILNEQKLLDALEGLKGHQIAIADQCKSGGFPAQLVAQQHAKRSRGLAFSPGLEDENTSCSYFTKALFDAIEGHYDPDGDGLATLREAINKGMVGYSTALGSDVYGSLAMTVLELSEDNYDRIVGTRKAAIIEIGATWCGPCKAFMAEVHQLWGLVGDQVNFAAITVDLDKDGAEKLFHKMGIPAPDSYPTVYITTDGGKTFKLFSPRKKEEIALALEKVAGVEIEKNQIIEEIKKQLPKLEEEKIRDMVEFGIQWVQVIRQMARHEGAFEEFKLLVSEYKNPNFSVQDKAYLFVYGIRPEQANDYPKAYDSGKLRQLVAFGISSDIAGSYPERFPVYQIRNLLKEGISGNEVMPYADHFSYRDIQYLLKNRIGADVANAYPAGIEPYQIKVLIDGGIVPGEISKKVAPYQKRFTVNDAVSLILDKIPAEKALLYDAHFGVQSIRLLVENKIDPEIANRALQQYDSAIAISDIAILLTQNISPEIANQYFNKYHESISSWRRCEFLEAGITPDQANEALRDYSKSFHHYVLKLIDAGIDAYLANQYEGFSAYDVIELVEAGVTPEAAQRAKIEYGEGKAGKLLDLIKVGDPIAVRAYGDRPDIAELISAGISPEKADEFDSRFSARDIQDLIRNGIPNQVANSYGKRFRGSEVVSLAMEGVTWEEASEYPERFSGYDIVTFKKAGLERKDVEGYNHRLGGSGIVALIEAGIDPIEAAKYEGLSAMEIKKFKSWGLQEAALKEYDARFKTRDIMDLIEYDIPNEVAVEYGASFSGSEIVYFLKYEIPPATALAFRQHSYVSNIASFVYEGITKGLIASYPKSLPPHVIIRYIKEGIGEVELTNWLEAYPGQTVNDIKYYLENDCDPDLVEWVKTNYKEGPNPLKVELRDLVLLAKEGYDLALLKEYDDIFEGNHIVILVRKGISPETANQDIGSYGKNFDRYEVIYFILDGIGPDQVSRYAGLNASDIRFLIKYGIAHEEAIAYHATAGQGNEQLFVRNIVQLIHRGISPTQFGELIRGYDDKFSINNKCWFILHDLDPAMVNPFSEKFLPEKIEEYLAKAFDGMALSRLAEQYGKLGHLPVDDLITAGIEPSEFEQKSKEYAKRFSAHNAAMLMTADIKGDIANQYHIVFSARDIIALFQAGILWEEANSKFFEFYVIANGNHQVALNFLISGLSAEAASDELGYYDFELHFASEFLAKGIDPGLANTWKKDYDSHFNSYEIKTLIFEGISPEVANSRKRDLRAEFDAHDIVYFVKNDISSEEANTEPLFYQRPRRI